MALFFNIQYITQGTVDMFCTEAFENTKEKTKNNRLIKKYRVTYKRKNPFFVYIYLDPNYTMHGLNLLIERHRKKSSEPFMFRLNIPCATIQEIFNEDPRFRKFINSDPPPPRKISELCSTNKKCYTLNVKHSPILPKCGEKISYRSMPLPPEIEAVVDFRKAVYPIYIHIRNEARQSTPLQAPTKSIPKLSRKDIEKNDLVKEKRKKLEDHELYERVGDQVIKKPFIMLGKNSSQLPIKIVEKLDWNNPSKALRLILVYFFGRQTLAISSLTGKRSAGMCIQPILLYVYELTRRHTKKLNTVHNYVHSIVSIQRFYFTKNYFHVIPPYNICCTTA